MEKYEINRENLSFNTDEITRNPIANSRRIQQIDRYKRKSSLLMKKSEGDIPICHA